MTRMIAHVTLLVRDYDEAVAYYTTALGFSLIQDRALGSGKRWVVVAPPGGHGSALLLARAATPDHRWRASATKRVAAVMDPKKRLELYHRINRLWVEDAAAMPLYQQVDLYGVAKRNVWKARGDERVKGFDMALK